MTKIDIDLYNNGLFKKQIKDRIIRMCPDSEPGIVYKKKVYKVQSNNRIDISQDHYSTNDCPFIENYKLIAPCGTLISTINNYIPAMAEALIQMGKSDQVLYPKNIKRINTKLLYKDPNYTFKQHYFDFCWGETDNESYYEYDVYPFNFINEDWVTIKNIDAVAPETNFLAASIPFIKPVEALELVEKIFDNMAFESQLIINCHENVLNNVSSRKKIKELENNQIFIYGVFWMPEGIFKSESSIRPYLIHFSRQKVEKIFIADLTNQKSDYSRLGDYLINSLNTRFENLYKGYFIRLDEFKGFTNFILTQQISEFDSQYKEYDQSKLGSAIEKISEPTTHNKAKHIKNVLYMPKHNSHIIKTSSAIESDCKNYYQVKLDKSKVLSPYASIFYNTQLGQTVLESFRSGGTFKKLAKADIYNIPLPLPSIEHQFKIVAAHNMAIQLRNELDSFLDDLTIAPNKANQISERLEKALKSLSKLTEADKIKAIIRGGETKTSEFKETYSLCIHTNKKDERIQKAVLKNIVAFLNSSGGTLLIGVSDSNDIVGLEREIEKLYKNSTDKLLLDLKNRIKEDIGPAFYDFLDQNIIDVDGKSILQITCKKSNKECFLNGDEFYVRTTPAADRLTGTDMIEYIKSHFD